MADLIKLVNCEMALPCTYLKERELIRMRFGIYLGRVVKLVDWETGEIIVCGAKSVNEYLHAFEGNYTLQLIS